MARNITLRQNDFEFTDSRVGEESIVAQHTVPKTKVYGIDNSRPYSVALSSSYSHTIASGEVTVNLQADLDAFDVPQITFMDNYADNQHSRQANVVVYADINGDGNYDTLVDGSTQVSHIVGDYAETDEIEELTFQNDTGGEVDLQIVLAQKGGQVQIRKTASGSSRVSQTLEKASSRTLIYSAPDRPDGASQQYLGEVGGKFGKIIPPRFKVDIVYYSENEQVDLASENVENIHIALPFKQRSLDPSEDAGRLRQKVRSDMVNNS